MKKIGFLFAIASLSFSTLIYAAPEGVMYDAEISSENEINQVYSSDSDEVLVQNVDSVIENKVSLTNFVEPIKIISGINDGTKEGFSTRTSPINWVFALFYILWLKEYGEKLKRKKKLGQHWFRKPLLVGILIYLIHAPLHLLFADPIFLIYYAMLIFDIAIAGFIYYYFGLHLGKVNSKQTRKVKAH